MTWTAERLDELRAGWAAGNPCSQIAAGLGVTRNAVIGKARRLNLEARRSGYNAAVRAGIPPRPRPPRLVHSQPSRSTPFIMPKAAVAPLPAMPKHDGRPIAFLDLTEQHCRWPVTAELPHMFCGAARVMKQPYCEKHCQASYPCYRRA